MDLHHTVKRAVSLVFLALSIAALICGTGPATSASQASADTGVEIASQQTNIQQVIPTDLSLASTAALDYVVLRDNFKTYATCESYRKNYVVNYPYHLASYCTRAKQSNGRHWLYVAYDECPDIAPKTRPEDLAA